MDTGSGDDRVLLDLASIAGRVRIATGSGDDDVRVAGGSSLSADALVSAGAGADRLGFDDVALGRGLKLALDDGSDIAAVNFTSAVSGLAVSGGDGFDFYLDGEGNAFSSLRLVGVESTP